MNAGEQRLADDLYQAMMEESRYSGRSEQARAFRVGISDLGFCQERTRRMLDGQQPEDTDELPAWIGTALGEHAERSWLRRFPDAIVQCEVPLVHEVTIHGRPYEMTLHGHPDFIIPDGILIDGKTVNGLSSVERLGPEDHQQMQRHQYALAAWRAGKFRPGVNLEDVQVANVWIDRSAEDRRLYVQMEPFDMGWVTAARDWLSDVVYAYVNKEPAKKEPPRTMCAKVCGFYADCRAFDTDVSGLITNERHLAMVDQFVTGRDQEGEGKRLRSQARAYLEEFGVEGSTKTWLVRWTHVNQSGERKGYDRLEVVKMPEVKV